MREWYPLKDIRELAEVHLGKNEVIEAKPVFIEDAELDLHELPVTSNVPPLPQIEKEPPSYIIQAVVGLIFSFFCLFLPMIPAVVAVVFASKVNGLHLSGDYEGALNASKKAKLWCNLTGAAFILVILFAMLAEMMGV